ncbi:MAG: hypothetical protein GY826_38065, partial [Fuerstiella sp.]|nr:hypothetical protein [Fuerstiella sp.]
MVTQDGWATRPLLVTALEERILKSASPLAVVAEAPEASTERSQTTNQQMLDLIADSVLPEPSAATVCSPVTAQERETVLINS